MGKKGRALAALVEGHRASRDARPLHRLYGENNYQSIVLSPKRGRFVVCTRTDMTPHFLETPSVITTAEFSSHIVHECEGVCIKAVSRNCGIDLGTGARRNFGTVAESKVEMAWELGVERRATVLFVDEPPGWNGAKLTVWVDYTRHTASSRRRGRCEGAD